MFSSTTLGALAALFTVLAALFGLWAWGKSYFEGKEKDAAIKQFKRDALAKQTVFETQLEAQRQKTEEQREKTAKAELQLKRLVEWQNPRTTLAGALVDALEGKKSAKAEILYQDGVGEVYDFAGFLKPLLLHAKWDVPTEPRPINDNDRSGEISGIPMEEVRKWPPPRRVGASTTGVTLIGNAATTELGSRESSTAFKDILIAFNKAGILTGIGQDKSLPDGFVRIVVAPR